MISQKPAVPDPGKTCPKCGFVCANSAKVCLSCKGEMPAPPFRLRNVHVVGFIVVGAAVFGLGAIVGHFSTHVSIKWKRYGGGVSQGILTCGGRSTLYNIELHPTASNLVNQGGFDSKIGVRTHNIDSLIANHPDGLRPGESVSVSVRGQADHFDLNDATASIGSPTAKPEPISTSESIDPEERFDNMHSD